MSEDSFWDISSLCTTSKCKSTLNVNNDYLKLLNFLKLFQVWNQPYSIFKSFQEFYLECYHFSQIPKENIQLIREKKKQHAQSITVKVTLQVNHVFFRTSVILSPVIHVCVMSGMKNTIYPLLYNVLK